MKLAISLAAFLLLVFSPISIHSTSSARILLLESRIDNKHHDEESDDRFTCSYSRCSKYGNFVDWFEVKLESVTGQSAPRYCADHRKDMHIDCGSAFRRCQRVDCTRFASFGIAGGSPLFCVSHKGPGHSNLVTRHCEYIGAGEGGRCGKVASFGDRMNRRLRFCGSHKMVGDVNLRAKMCEIADCPKQASFGDPMMKQMRFCKAHSPQDFVNMKNKPCLHKGCPRQASKGLATVKDTGEMIRGDALFCAQHAGSSSSMLNVNRRRCPGAQGGLGCGRLASFGQVGGEEGSERWCFEHRGEESKDLGHKKCSGKDCDKQPVFGPPRTRAAVTCAAHRDPCHVDLVHRRCEYAEGCSRRHLQGKNMCSWHDGGANGPPLSKKASASQASKHRISGDTRKRGRALNGQPNG